MALRKAFSDTIFINPLKVEKTAMRRLDVPRPGHIHVLTTYFSTGARLSIISSYAKKVLNHACVDRKIQLKFPR